MDKLSVSFHAPFRLGGACVSPCEMGRGLLIFEGGQGGGASAAFVSSCHLPCQTLIGGAESVIKNRKSQKYDTLKHDLVILLTLLRLHVLKHIMNGYPDCSIYPHGPENFDTELEDTGADHLT